MAPLPGRVSSTLQRHDIKLQRPLFFLAGAVLLFSERQGKGSIPEGRLAQLVEHLVYTERVSGSSPLPPTIFPILDQSLSCMRSRMASASLIAASSRASEVSRFFFGSL